jgi:hypothetical protein
MKICLMIKIFSRKIFVLKFICNHYFSPLNTFYEKREGSGAGTLAF